jgi:hypothetical protein
VPERAAISAMVAPAYSFSSMTAAAASNMAATRNLPLARWGA